MFGNLVKFSALSRSDQWIFLVAALTLLRSWVLLRLRGVDPLRDSLREAVGSEDASSIAQSTHIGALVNASARHMPFPATCLTRSLALTSLLRRRGIAARVRIGAQRDRDALRAHAWVEVGGVPVNDAGVSGAFGRLETAGAP